VNVVIDIITDLSLSKTFLQVHHRTLFIARCTQLDVVDAKQVAELKAAYLKQAAAIGIDAKVRDRLFNISVKDRASDRSTATIQAGKQQCPKEKEKQPHRVLLDPSTLTWMCLTCQHQFESKLKYTSQVNELLESSLRVLPTAYRDSLICAQRVNNKLKVKKSIAIIVTAATSACAVGWTPIPSSDAPVLIGIQTGMIGGLIVVWGVKVNRQTILSCAAANSGVGLAGYTVASLLKFIPGVGTLAGGVIDAAIATTFTVAFGLAFMMAFQSAVEKNFDQDPEQVTNMIETFANPANLARIMDVVRRIGVRDEQRLTEYMVARLVDDKFE